MLATHAAAEPPPAWQQLIGQRPVEWHLTDWLNSPPLSLEGLRGHVVLIRWWTAPQCPYCRATAPALHEFAKMHGERGLVVIGVYHHKAKTPLRTEDVRGYAEQFGFTFPVAIDPEWRTLKRWWLKQGGERWTSVSFLLDREGRIRHVHPGGQYVKGDEDYDEMQRKIGELLAEPVPARCGVAR